MPYEAQKRGENGLRVEAFSSVKSKISASWESIEKNTDGKYTKFG